MSADDAFNPYEAPTVTASPPAPEEDGLIRMRQEHLSVEAGVYAFGILDVVGGVLAGGVSAVSLAIALRSQPSFQAWVILLTNTLLAVLLAYTGLSLLRLQPHGRVLQSAVFVLLTYGTLNVHALGGLLITLLWAVVFVTTFLSAKARTVFTRRYREVVIPASPQLPLALRVGGRLALLGVAVLVPFVMLYQVFEPRFR